MTIRMFVLAVLLFAGHSAQSHPHDDVEQQALLSVGLDTATLEVRIVPSFDEGAQIFDHLDLDGSGDISVDEATAFGKRVLEHAVLTVEGSPVDLGNLRVAIPDRGQVSSGLGLITVTSEGTYPALNGETARIAFEITYEDLSHDWFVQPFFFPDLNSALKLDDLERSSAGHHVALRFSRKEN